MNNDLLVEHSIITSAINHLRKGELVAFPTETVYGLGADASNESALRKLYALKGRPSNHPVIIHLASGQQLDDWGTDLSESAKLLAKNFWPGPLTLIVKKSSHVSLLVTGGQDTVGLRVPNHPVALALLEGFGGGIAAPSANRYGRVSATCAQHVRDEFGEEVSVIDGGTCSLGIESTIVDIVSNEPRILRPGMIGENEILKCLGLNHSKVGTSLGEENIRVPGSDKTHYAPQTPTFLLDKKAIYSLLSETGNRDSYAILAFTEPNINDKRKEESKIFQFIQASVDPKSYAHDIYNNLRRLDGSGATKILIEVVPETIEWLPIKDRLWRASVNVR